MAYLDFFLLLYKAGGLASLSLMSASNIFHLYNSDYFPVQSQRISSHSFEFIYLSNLAESDRYSEYIRNKH